MSDVAVIDRSGVRETRVPSHGRGRIVTTPIWTKENYPRNPAAEAALKHNKPPRFTSAKVWQCIATLRTRQELEAFAALRVMQDRPPRGITHCDHCGHANGAASVAILGQLDRWVCSTNCAGTLLALMLQQARKELSMILVDNQPKK